MEELGVRAAYPALVCLVCGALNAVVPFTDLWLDWNFQRFSNERERIVQAVRTGALQPPPFNSFVQLGSTTSSVSKGGNEILVEEHDGKKYVFFFTYRGILDNYSGFLNVQGRGDPKRFFDLARSGASVTPLEGDWYFVAHW